MTQFVHVHTLQFKIYIALKKVSSFLKWSMWGVIGIVSVFTVWVCDVLHFEQIDSFLVDYKMI